MWRAWKEERLTSVLKNSYRSSDCVHSGSDKPRIQSRIYFHSFIHSQTVLFKSSRLLLMILSMRRIQEFLFIVISLSLKSQVYSRSISQFSDHCWTSSSHSFRLHLIYRLPTVGGLFLWPALRYGTGYQTVAYERPGHQQRLLQTFTEDVFIFSLLVYIAH